MTSEIGILFFIINSLNHSLNQIEPKSIKNIIFNLISISGMILLSELSRRRIRSINKLIRIGKSECVVVIRVDKEKGYIDLSKRRVLPEDIVACEDKFAKAKAVNSILRHVAEILNYQTDEQLEELYSKTAWHFDDKMKRKGAAFEAFKAAVK